MSLENTINSMQLASTMAAKIESRMRGQLDQIQWDAAELLVGKCFRLNNVADLVTKINSLEAGTGIYTGMVFAHGVFIELQIPWEWLSSEEEPAGTWKKIVEEFKLAEATKLAATLSVVGA